jgi:hypothetical protein
MGLRAGLDTEARGKILCPELCYKWGKTSSRYEYREQGESPSYCKPVAKNLYKINYKK